MHTSGDTHLGAAHRSDGSGRARLGDTGDVQAFIPGDPQVFDALAHALSEDATTLGATLDRFKGIDDGGWSGAAADAYHARVGSLRTCLES